MFLFKTDEDFKPLPRLTPLQHKVLLYLVDYFAKNQEYPTQREITVYLEKKTTNAMPYLSPLLAKGYIEKVPGRRGIRLSGQAIKLLRREGRIQEGQATLPLQTTAEKGTA